MIRLEFRNEAQSSNKRFTDRNTNYNDKEYYQMNNRNYNFGSQINRRTKNDNTRTHQKYDNCIKTLN